jgi:hypothetical protein
MECMPALNLVHREVMEDKQVACDVIRREIVIQSTRVDPDDDHTEVIQSTLVYRTRKEEGDEDGDDEPSTE